jgi:hypothetical protein
LKVDARGRCDGTKHALASALVSRLPGRMVSDVAGDSHTSQYSSIQKLTERGETRAVLYLQIW